MTQTRLLNALRSVHAVGSYERGLHIPDPRGARDSAAARGTITPTASGAFAAKSAALAH